MSKFINYGDYIFLTFPQRKEDSFYYLHGKSILDPHVSSISSKDLLKKGFRNCVFQIFPRNCQFLLDNLKENSQNSSEFFQKEWKSLLQDEIQRHIGSPVLYGDSVHLLHLQTRSFLGYEVINKGENTIQTSRLYLMQDISQERTCFQFDTVSNYYYPGEKICYNTNILVKHSNTSHYMTFLTDDFTDKSANSESSFMGGPIMELSMNALPMTMVQITQYSDPKKINQCKESNYILNGDFVRIYDLRLVRENLEVHKFYLEQRDDDNEEKREDLVLNYFNNNTSSLSHQKIVTSYSSHSLSAMNIFQIINPDEIEKSGCPIKLFPKSQADSGNLRNIKKPYLLKHVISSSYVLNPISAELNSQMKLDLKSKDNIENLDRYRVCLFKLSGREDSLLVNSNFLIGDYSALKEELLFVAQSAEEDPERVVKTIALKDKSSQPELNVMYYKDERLLAENYNTFSLKWDRESNLSESLRCEIVTEDELYNLNFFIASNEVLNDLNAELESLRKIAQKDIQACFNQVLVNVEKIKGVIVKILLFITDRKLEGEYVHDEKFVPATLKQNYLRELRVIETLNGIILKLTLVAANYTELPITKDKRFEELIANFTYLLKLYMLNNTSNINDLMRSVKIYLRYELMQRLTNVVTEVLNHSEFASLNLIMEILKLFIYDKSSNHYTNYSPHSELSVKILKILFAASKFKSFCIALQRYRKFWSAQFIQSVFPKLVLNQDTGVLEVHYRDSHLMNLIDIRSENNLTLEADYVMSSFHLITVLAKKLPNFQRLSNALKNFIPYEACLEVVKYVENEKYSYTTKKLMLDLLFHFHFKYLLSQGLYWPHPFIKACNVNLPTYPDIQITEQKMQSTNSLPQKLTLVNVYNLYNKKLRSLLNEKYVHNKETLKEILDILEFCSIFFSNDIIEFPDKKPFLILYHGYYELNKKLDKHLEEAGRINEAESLLISKIRGRFKEIQTSINQAIESFFAKEYLLFLRHKYSLSNGAADLKSPLQHLQAALNISKSVRSSPRGEIHISRRNSRPLEPERIRAFRKSSITEFIDPQNKFVEFTEIRLDNYKYEEDLKDFLGAWDDSLEPYSLSLQKIVENQLSYVEDSKMEFKDIILLEKLSSRFKTLVNQLKNVVILENNSEIMEILEIYTSLKGVSEMIESFAKDNNISGELFDNTEKELQKTLFQLGIDTKIIREAKIDTDNVLSFLLENPFIFDINYSSTGLGRNDSNRQKFQDAMRILKIYEGLLDILDYFVTSTNEYYMPRTLKCRLYVVQILLYFIHGNSTNCQALHKLLVTAYFYEVYSGKIYTTDVVVYMQILLSNLFKHSSDLLTNDNEVKRLFQIFYEPYLRNVIELNYRHPNSPASSPMRSMISPKSMKCNSPLAASPKKDVSHLMTPQVNRLTKSPRNAQKDVSHLMNSSPNLSQSAQLSATSTKKDGMFLTVPVDLSQSQFFSQPLISPPSQNQGQAVGANFQFQSSSKSKENSGVGNFSLTLINMKSNSSHQPIIKPIEPPPAMEKLTLAKYQATLIMCSFTLNAIQAFFKTTSKPLQAKFQGHLQDLFFLNSEVFSHYITETSKYKFDSEDLEFIWLKFYQNLLKACTEFANTSPVMQDYLLSTFETLHNLNNFILQVKKNHPYGLKTELMSLGSLLFPNFEETEENSKAKTEFLFITVYETLIFMECELSTSKNNTEELKRTGSSKAKSLKIWEEIKSKYGVDLLENVEEASNDPDRLTYFEKNQGQIQQNVYGNILKFYKYLCKYQTPFCMRTIETTDGKDRIAIMDVLMGILSELLEVSKFDSQHEKVKEIRNNLLTEVRNNKDYGKFHQQMKVIDFLLTFETPTLLNIDSANKSISHASVATVFESTVEKFLSEENVKSLENGSLMTIVDSIEENPLSEKILKQILSIIQSEQYSGLTKESYSFFCLLMRELLKKKILTLEEKIDEFEYLIPHVKQVQKVFGQYDFVQFVFKNMVECNEESLLIFLEMANLMLYGGYDKVQKSFYECFMSDHENRLMLKLSAQLKKISERFLRKEKIRNSANQMLLLRKKLKNDHLKHKDDNDSLLLSNILRLINLLCENHNRDFQQFFKEQNHENKLNSISINFPIELCIFINSYVDVCNYYSFSIGHQLFGAIIEIVQGDSRDIIYEMCNRTTIINDILLFLTKYQPNTDLYKGRRFEGNTVMETLKSDAINLLMSIVESSDQETKQIIAEEINYTVLIKVTVDFISDFFKKNKISINQCHDTLMKIRDDEFVARGGLGDRLNLLIVIKALQRSSHRFRTEIANVIQECEETLRNEFQFYMDELGGKFIQSIEIIDKNKELRKIYFSQLPSCFYLDQTIKHDIIERIDRSAYHVKISEYLGDAREMHYKMKSQMETALNPRFIYITQMYPKLKSYSYTLAYIINILIMLYFQNEDLDIIYADTYSSLNSYFYVFLNFIQLMLSLSILIVWFGTNEPKFHLMKKWTKFEKENSKKSRQITFEEEQRWHLRPESITLQEYIRILKLKGPNAKELQDPITKGINIPEVQYEYLKYTIIFLFKSATFINNLTYVINCWLSLVVHPIFCSLQLLNSLAESKIMQSVISSFSKNAREIGITLGGCVIIVFIYSLVGFFFLRDSFMVSDYENVCTSIWHCFISLVNFGMRSGGGIGDVLTPESYIKGNMKIYTGRWFYDISFFLIIIVVMLNLIFGIVIDTFSNIRTEKIENQEDQTGKCFICDIDRGMLERVGSGFEQHTIHEHYMWNYIFYIVHIRLKGAINLSEIENYVFDCSKNKDYSWVPYKKALCMRGRGGEDELERDLDQIKDRISKIEIKMDTLINEAMEKKEKRKKPVYKHELSATYQP